jgi:general stress protein 26
MESRPQITADRATWGLNTGYLWVSDLNRWFPEGIDTLGIVLIKVSARSIEYWDGEENGRVDFPGGATIA